jgi:tripartite-type tricarboxylate transporter receptor subunit TctC
VKELVALAKVRSFNAAINTLASVHHLLTEMFNHAAGIKMNNIPYKGGALAATDVVGGQVELLWSVLPLVQPFIQNGRLRALAVAGDKRSIYLPNVPTMSESGWPSIAGTGWNGVVAPAGTPKSILDRLNAEIGRTLNAPDVRERFTTLGFEALGGTPEEFGAYMRAETVKWAGVIRTANIKLE